MSRSVLTLPGRSKVADSPASWRGRFGTTWLAVATCVTVLFSLGSAAPALAVSTVTASAVDVREPGTALINADTVSGGMESVEAIDAQTAGLTVTVVSGSEWDAMTADEFGSYRVLIAGDPACGTIADSFSSNVETWAPVVLGRAGGRTIAGNRVAIGTDPIYHGPEGFKGAYTLIQDGIDYASVQPGRTGLYLDASCSGELNQPGLAAQLLQQVSTGSGTWTQNNHPPCDGPVAKTASTPKFDSLNSLDSEGWGCSAHETFPTFASDWIPLAIATDTPSHPICGSDSTSGARACGEAYLLIAGAGIVAKAPDIALSPLAASDAAGGWHSVTATVTRAGIPVSGQEVTFTLSGVNASGPGRCDSGPACATNSAGQVSYAYVDINGVGSDTIIASYADGSTGSKQSATAAEEWTASDYTLAVRAATQLNRAAGFSVLAGAATTIPGATISGDVGANAALTITASTIAGVVHESGDRMTTDAVADLGSAYAELKALPATELPRADLGETTVLPGVYHSVVALAATGTVTFDALNDPDAVFIIQSDAALNTTASTTMILSNGAKSSNIFWVTTGAATLGASSVFDGIIISNAASTIGAGTVLNGDALSVTAAVTLGADCTLTAGLTASHF